MRATDGGGVAQVTSGVAIHSKPTWSPDGTRLAFTCMVESGNSDVCVVIADGSGFVSLTSSPTAEFDPAWSPDGTRLAFVTNRFTPGSTDIATMAPDGTNITLVSRITSGSLYYANPDWWPDGTRIAYWQHFFRGSSSCDAWDEFNQCYGTGPRMFVMNADGSGLGEPTWGEHPDWKPTKSYPPVTDEPPVARLTYTCTYLDCTFLSNSADDHGIRSHHWNIVDGTTSSSSGFIHRYAAPGTYQVTLTVRDYDGHSASTAQTVTVQSQPPIASFSWNCVGHACSFNSSASSDDMGIVSRTWAFGDGSSLNDVISPSHTYSVHGSYEVTLTVRDGLGLSSNITQSVTVPRDDAPVARFTYSCSNGTCVFDGSASTDDWGIVSYRWEVGGRHVADGPAVTLSFKGRPTITVRLTVTDQAGQTNSTTQTVTLK